MLTRLPILKVRQVEALLKKFSLDVIASITAEDLGISRHTVNQWFNHWREAILEHGRIAPRFAGEVEVDQTQLTGRGAKKNKFYRKHQEDAYGAPRNAEWKKFMEQRRKKKELELKKSGKKPWKPVKAIGIMSRSGKVYTQIIEDERRDTLMPIIYMVVEEGSTIYTDSWRSYGTLKEDKYQHKVVDHSKAFTNASGNHINFIESFWSFAKRRLTKFNGLSKHRAILHLKECEFRWNHGQGLGEKRWQFIMKNIREFAPLPKKSQKRKLTKHLKFPPIRKKLDL